MTGDRVTAEKLYKQQQASKVEQAKRIAKAKTEAPRRVTRFAAGYCTDYVARLVPVTWLGNANAWARNAAAQGYRVNRIPQVGSIIQTNESWYGHVGFIEATNGVEVTFSEWNYAGRFVKTTRILNINDPRIVAIIHLN